MPIYRVIIDDRSYTVEVVDPTARPVQAIVDGYVIEVVVEDQAAVRGPAVVAPTAPAAAPVRPSAEPPTPSAPAPAPAAAGSNAVVAPLPGTIVSVSVAEGDRVERGQELCVLEAMKMNNPIRATASGEVKEVLVSVGQQVQYGDPLMVMIEA